MDVLASLMHEFKGKGPIICCDRPVENIVVVFRSAVQDQCVGGAHAVKEVNLRTVYPTSLGYTRGSRAVTSIPYQRDRAVVGVYFLTRARIPHRYTKLHPIEIIIHIMMAQPSELNKTATERFVQVVLRLYFKYEKMQNNQFCGPDQYATYICGGKVYLRVGALAGTRAARHGKYTREWEHSRATVYLLTVGGEAREEGEDDTRRQRARDSGQGNARTHPCGAQGDGATHAHAWGASVGSKRRERT
ncbi:hypothetical protein BDN70DRAFT_899746 [Pholiota conissans]|uniref:Uncharacterized protein n=1 Tax=Pholiota conissans TaxID=109636 RepID=A0A9P5YRN7_9AGAR|nr:hypothetical protein BDN70DRAFT_899746 [Pholiota conissans]